MQNIEFKAELRDLEAARVQCQVLGAEFISRLRQIDTYYKMADGRLKQRETEGEPTVWVFYHRPDRAHPRMSNYTILSHEQAERRWGTQSLRPWVTVAKTRELWMMRNVRIHVDEVDELGPFVEFEAIVSRDHDVRSCHQRIAELRDAFAPILGEPISHSYSDLVDQAHVA